MAHHRVFLMSEAMVSATMAQVNLIASLAPSTVLLPAQPHATPTPSLQLRFLQALIKYASSILAEEAHIHTAPTATCLQANWW
jgi:hypothetical protein